VGGGSGSEITTGEDKVTKRGRKYGGKIVVLPKKSWGTTIKVWRGGEALRRREIIHRGKSRHQSHHNIS
jgi:hypothetical protein